MSKNSLVRLVEEEKIMNKIHVIRNHKVMLDFDLAEMYGVETKRLNEQLKRNLKRFPKDFMFTLSEKETQHLRSQNATSSWGGNRRKPNAFTEQGVALRTKPYCTPSPRKETVLFKFPLKNKVADLVNIPTEDPLKPKTTVAVAPGRMT
jgi:hypothetical protein